VPRTSSSVQKAVTTSETGATTFRAAPASLQAAAFHALQLIGAVAGLLVLLGLTNVANLLIFTGLAAGHEVAVRKALGASAGRLLQLRLIESILLTLLGALAGLGVAAGLGRLFSDFALPGIGTIEVAIDWRVILAVACLAVVTGTCAGIAPALLAVRESVTGALGRGIRTRSPRAGISGAEGRSRRRNTMPVSGCAGRRLMRTFWPVCSPTPVALTSDFRVLWRSMTARILSIEKAASPLARPGGRLFLFVGGNRSRRPRAPDYVKLTKVCFTHE